jgi:hypothetical protein
MSVAVPSDADHDDLVTILEELAAEVEQLREENERLRKELEAAKDHAAAERAELAGRVTEVEETVDDLHNGETDGKTGEEAVSPATNGGQTPEATTQQPETPLGDVVTLPETVAEQELTANVKRARDVAADVIDYGRSVPAGYTITSSELRTVLTALSDGEGRTYTETVGRVIGYLDELGGEDVQVKETMGGERTVIFSDEFVRRTVAWRNQSNQSDHGVVAEGAPTG